MGTRVRRACAPGSRGQPTGGFWEKPEKPLPPAVQTGPQACPSALTRGRVRPHSLRGPLGALPPVRLQRPCRVSCGRGARPISWMKTRRLQVQGSDSAPASLVPRGVEGKLLAPTGGLSECPRPPWRRAAVTGLCLSQVHYDEFIPEFEKQYPEFPWRGVQVSPE